MLSGEISAEACLFARIPVGLIVHSTFMITPAFLKNGDKIGIIATARKISREEVDPAIRVFRSWGLEVVEGNYLYAVDNQFAGNDSSRASDLQQMLDDPSIRAIVCARGGYGTVRLLSGLDFTGFMQHPKWIVGYSDITVLHSHIHRHLGVETIHGIMPVNFPSGGSNSESVEVLRKCLFGEAPSYTVNPEVLSRKGYARGEVIGGNLSILYSLGGTSSDTDTTGKILFIEDLDEYLYHIDRMMMNLKLGGKLENLAGLVVGGMTDMRDNTVSYGHTAEEIIADAVKEFRYPVLFGFPAGHQQKNMPLILGREAVLNVDESNASLSFMQAGTGHRGGKLLNFLKPVAFIVGFFSLLYLLYSLLTGRGG